jgi:hypothetical protein
LQFGAVVGQGADVGKGCGGYGGEAFAEGGGLDLGEGGEEVGVCDEDDVGGGGSGEWVVAGVFDQFAERGDYGMSMSTSMAVFSELALRTSR